MGRNQGLLLIGIGVAVWEGESQQFHHFNQHFSIQIIRRQHRTLCDAGGMVAKTTMPNRIYLNYPHL